jgi:hypothetical protein
MFCFLVLGQSVEILTVFLFCIMLQFVTFVLWQRKEYLLPYLNMI